MDSLARNLDLIAGPGPPVVYLNYTETGFPSRKTSADYAVYCANAPTNSFEEKVLLHQLSPLLGGEVWLALLHLPQPLLVFSQDPLNVPGGHLVRHHDLLVSVGHQTPHGLLANVFDGTLSVALARGLGLRLGSFRVSSASQLGSDLGVVFQSANPKPETEPDPEPDPEPVEPEVADLVPE
ncbi:hypothetical protein EYF80_046234 [Liparis tanakae]|uniref:Uncharacterized protein n=1 Tax=Liparis tanakae TaxID=230148 RepID=A0A4Z2FRF5_9TELE|nr:hypothetical protein EYF80_046234 [Liparis tanakae]